MNIMLAYGGDQKSVNAYGKRKLVSPRNTKAYSIIVTNKGATDFWVQVYDVTGADEDAAGTAADLVEPQYEVQCFSGSFVGLDFPTGWQCHHGCYVRCVDAADGAEADLIATDDAKITASFADGPIL